MRVSISWRQIGLGIGFLLGGVFVILAAMMLRSWFYGDSLVCVTPAQQVHMLTSYCGKVFYYKMDGAFAYPHTDMQSLRTTDPLARATAIGDDSPMFCGFAFRTEACQIPPLGGKATMFPGEVNIIIPYWLLMVLSGVWPTVLIVRKVRSNRRLFSFPVS
jgi:hypothetical protein